MGSLARVITTKEATLETVTVEIRVITLNGKQMTLAVFRQLPIGDDFETEEEPQRWGIVRYDIKDEGNLWLVFSDGGKLYRRRVNVYEDRDRIRPFEREVDAQQLEIKRIQEGKTANPGDEAMQRLTAESNQALRIYQEELKAELTRMEMDQELVNTLPQLFIAV